MVQSLHIPHGVCVCVCVCVFSSPVAAITILKSNFKISVRVLTREGGRGSPESVFLSQIFQNPIFLSPMVQRVTMSLYRNYLLTQQDSKTGHQIVTLIIKK